MPWNLTYAGNSGRVSLRKQRVKGALGFPERGVGWGLAEGFIKERQMSH
jgi:hypothetical protein